MTSNINLGIQPPEFDKIQVDWQTLKKEFHNAIKECKPLDWYEEKWLPKVEGLLEQEEKRGVGKNWIKIDIKDINTIIGLLKGGVENQKIINFIENYVYGQFKQNSKRN